jgi:hypothetical protein
VPSSFLTLSDSWSSFPVFLIAGDSYALVLDTTFQFSGLASGEAINIDLPQSADVDNTPEPATWGLVASAMVLAVWARRRTRAR